MSHIKHQRSINQCLLVSKRYGNRRFSVVVALEGFPEIAPLQSEPTMVYSKRKNKDQRLEEQAKERNELAERQKAAAALMSARGGTPACAATSGVTSAAAVFTTRPSVMP